MNLLTCSIRINVNLSDDVKLPEQPLNFNRLSTDEIDQELQKGYQEILDGKGIPARMVFEELRKKYEG
jgi:DNA-damage-inducible protein J